MLTALMSGKALTATELSREAGITLQTASSHLSKLGEGGLLNVRKQGRHKYFALANDQVASVLESVMGLVAGNVPLRVKTGPGDDDLRHARVCYNHLAGERGIALYESLINQGLIEQRDQSLVLSPDGARFAESFGIDLQALRSSKSPLCRECLDWSERRSHLAGSFGRGLFSRMESLGWLRRLPDSRVVRFTRKGLGEFARTFPA